MKRVLDLPAICAVGKCSVPARPGRRRRTIKLGLGLLAAGISVNLAACGGSASSPQPASSAPASAASAAPANGTAASGGSASGSAPVAAGSAAAAKPSIGASASGASKAASPSTQANTGALTPVSLAYAQASASQAVLFVTNDAGFFTKHGLTVDLKRISGPAQIPALLSNELDFAGTGGLEAVDAEVGGAPVVMIATETDYPPVSLYVNKKYKTVQDLKGQTIGVTSAGSATDVTAQLFLKHFGLANDVKIQPSGGTQASLFAAMQKGFVAGGILSAPTTAKAADAGFVDLVNGVTLGVPLTYSTITVARAYLKSHMDVVKRFLAAYKEGWDFSGDPANKNRVVQILAKYTKSDQKLAEISYESIAPVYAKKKVPDVNAEGVANILSLDQNPKAKGAVASGFIDNSIIDALP